MVASHATDVPATAFANFLRKAGVETVSVAEEVIRWITLDPSGHREGDWGLESISLWLQDCREKGTFAAPIFLGTDRRGSCRSEGQFTAEAPRNRPRPGANR